MGVSLVTWGVSFLDRCQDRKSAPSGQSHGPGGATALLPGWQVVVDSSAGEMNPGSNRGWTFLSARCYISPGAPVNEEPPGDESKLRKLHIFWSEYPLVALELVNRQRLF
jgi:hypothetical protein